MAPVGPPFDIVTPSVAVLADGSATIDVDDTLVDALSQAERMSRALVVVTPARTLVSAAALTAAERADWQWVVDGADRGFWCALTGHALAWDGERFTPADDPTAALPSLSEAVHDRGAVHVITAEVVHPLTQDLVGHLAEEVAAATGTVLRWGPTEPGEQVLSAPAVSRVAQAVAPVATHLALTGTRATGLLVIDPEPAGVVERVTLALTAPPPPDICEHLVARGAQVATWVVRPGAEGRLAAGPAFDPRALAVAAGRVPHLPGGHLDADPARGLHTWHRIPWATPLDAATAYDAVRRLVEEHSSWPPRNVMR